jgi:hypothetical protein
MLGTVVVRFSPHIGHGIVRACVRTRKLRDSWWEPPHLYGGRSALALQGKNLDINHAL